MATRFKIKNAAYAAGLIVLAGTFACAPMIIKWHHGNVNLTTSPKALTGSQVMRGAYVNSGSKDVGPDPDWVNGRYAGKSSRSFNPTDEEVRAHREEMMARGRTAAAAAADGRAGGGTANEQA